MATYSRAIAIIGSLWDLIWNRDHAIGTKVLGSHELSVAIDDDGVPGIYLQHRRIAGLEKDHGPVANQAAMLALHNAAGDALEVLAPRYVSPGDSCTRTDDPGWRWHCIAGHGLTLADWERRPLAGALTGLAVTGHTHTLASLTEVVSALSGKQASLANAATLARISDASGLPLWDGLAWPGGGGGSTSELWQLPCIQSWYGPELPPAKPTGLCGNGDGVAVWADSSRYARTMIQSDAGVRPTYVASLRNGNGGVKSASGTAQALKTGLLVESYRTGLVGDFTIWVTAQRSSASGLCLYSGSTDGARISLYWESGSLGVVVGGAAASVAYTATTNCESIKVTLRGTTLTFRVNSSTVGTATAALAPVLNNWYNHIGAYAATQGCDMTLGSYVLADGSLTSTQEAEIDAYLATLWGL